MSGYVSRHTQAAAEGPAMVLAVATTVPPFVHPTRTYPDYYFGMTNCNHMTALKDKFQRNSDPHHEWEKPLFEIQWAGTAVVPDSLEAIAGYPMEAGLYYHLSPDLPKMVSRSLEQVVNNAKSFAGHPEVNKMFWALHPGGAAILRQIETQLKLSPHKLKACRQVLDNYGNMSSACAFFVLDQLRKNSIEARPTTTGEGKDFGMLIGIGPGLTVETLLLRSIPLPPPTPLLLGQRQLTEDA